MAADKNRKVSANPGPVNPFDLFSRAELRQAKRLLREVDSCIFQKDRDIALREFNTYANTTFIKRFFGNPKDGWIGTMKIDKFTNAASEEVLERFTDVWPDMNQDWKRI